MLGRYDRAMRARQVQGGQTLLARAIAAIRRNNGALIMPAANVLGDGAPNLLSAPEDFSNAVWVKDPGGVITANTNVAPDDTLTADTLTVTTGQTLRQTISKPSVDAAYTGSVWVMRKSGGGDFSIRFVANGSVIAGSTVVPTLPLGAWIRVTTTANSGAFADLRLDFPCGTAGAYAIWGAKLEQGSVATAYTPQSVLRQRGSFVDSAGTTPVTVVGDLFGLLLDRCGTVGPERKQHFVTGVDGTASAAAYNTTTGVGSVTRVDFSNQSYVRITGLTAAASYQLSITNTGAGAINVRQASSGGAIITNIAVGATSPVVFTGNSVCVITSSGGTSTFVLNSFTELTGNHATQATTANKPTLTRVPRRLGPNLVVNGTFDSAAGWTIPAGWTIGSGVATGAATSSSLFSPATGIEAGKYYKITFDITAYTSGNCAVTIGQNYGGQRLANGVGPKSFVIQATNTARGVEFYGGSFTGAIDNVVVQEVLEWAYAMSFDGSNDYLQTGITTGNEGWICAGVTPTNSNSTIVCSGAGSNVQKGIWAYRTASNAAANMLVGNGTQVANAVARPMPAGVPCVWEGWWTPTTLGQAINGVGAADAARTGDATPPPAPLRIGAYTDGVTYPLNGPMTATVYCPVLPSAADRAIIRKWIGSLQGQTL